MSLRKIGIGIVSFAALILVSGCGDKDADNVKDMVNSGPAGAPNQENGSQKAMKEDLPAPTGKVDDVISALESDVAGEKNVISEEEKSASDVANDEEEADDFANTSDGEQL